MVILNVKQEALADIRCEKCNRRLKKPQKLGAAWFGPTCIKKVLKNIEEARKKLYE